MGGVLVVGSVADDCTAMADALRARGVDAVAIDREQDLGAAAKDKQAILADLDTAIELGWLRSTSPPAPLIVTSRHEAFLDVIRDRVAACLHSPFNVDDVIGTLQRLVDGTPPLERPRRGSPLDTPGRDAAIARFLDEAADPELLGLASLVARGARSDVCLIALLDSRRQTFIGHDGLPPDLLTARATPRDWSFCSHTIAGGERLVVGDAQTHPAFSKNPMVQLHLIGAYAGVPIVIEGFGVVGTVCIISQQPRTFGAAEFAILDLAAHVASERLSHRAVPRANASLAPKGSLELGELLDGKYWITARLASGGESEIFLARDRLTSRIVVIKWIWTRGDDALRTEARGLSAVRHPNIVQLHDWGKTADGRAYLVLEHVDGDSLATVIDEARARGDALPLGSVVTTVRALAGALASMHAAGFAHGDLKPGNVIVDMKLDRPVLIDFGFSTSIESADTAENTQNVHGGTPGFSAPEQFMSRSGAERVDARVDVYALAAMAYAMITGEGPFADAGSKERIAAQITERFRPASTRRRGVPDAIDRVLARALSADPTLRHASVLELSADIEGALAANESAGATGAIDAAAPRSRGVALRVYRETARRCFGEEDDRRAVAALDAADRAVIEETVEDDAYVPSAPLVSYLRALARGDRARIAALARAVSCVVLPGAFAALGVTRTPQTVLGAAEILLHRFHDWGRIEIEWRGPGSALSRLSLPEGFAPEMCTYLGELLRVLLETTGVQSTVHETTCASRGANACEMLITWADR